MFFKKSEHRKMNSYFTLAVGALAVVGAMSLARCAKGMIQCGYEKMSCMMKGVMGKSGREISEM